MALFLCCYLKIFSFSLMVSLHPCFRFWDFACSLLEKSLQLFFFLFFCLVLVILLMLLFFVLFGHYSQSIFPLFLYRRRIVLSIYRRWLQYRQIFILLFFSTHIVGICRTSHRPDESGTRLLFTWVQTQGRWQDTRTGSKNASGPVSIPLKRGTSGARQ